MEYTQQDVSDNSNTSLELASWLQQEGFIQQHPRCPEADCKSPANLQQSSVFKADGAAFRCSNSACKRRFSVRTGSFWPTAAKLSIGQQMRLLVAFAAKSSIASTSRNWNIARQTIGGYDSMFLNAIVEEVNLMIDGGDFKFGGGDDVVEIDETVLLNVYDDEHKISVPRIWIMGIKERSSGLMWLQRVPNRRTESLIPVIEEHVPFNTIVCTDELATYQQLSDRAYRHYTVNHSAKDYAHADTYFDGHNDVRFTVTTNGMEQVCANMKGRVRNAQYRTFSYIDRTLSRMMFESTGRSVFDLFKCN